MFVILFTPRHVDNTLLDNIVVPILSLVVIVTKEKFDPLILKQI